MVSAFATMNRRTFAGTLVSATVAQLAGCYVAGATVIAIHGILQRYTGWGIPATQVVSDLVFHKGIRSWARVLDKLAQG